jgi:hypothetical protein
MLGVHETTYPKHHVAMPLQLSMNIGVMGVCCIELLKRVCIELQDLEARGLLEIRWKQFFSNPIMSNGILVIYFKL